MKKITYYAEKDGRLVCSEGKLTDDPGAADPLDATNEEEALNEARELWGPEAGFTIRYEGLVQITLPEFGLFDAREDDEPAVATFPTEEKAAAALGNYDEPENYQILVCSNELVDMETRQHGHWPLASCDFEDAKYVDQDAAFWDD